MCVGFAAVGNDENYNLVEQALAQVTYQLRHLVSVWKNILPSHIYAKALGE